MNTNTSMTDVSPFNFSSQRVAPLLTRNNRIAPVSVIKPKTIEYPRIIQQEKSNGFENNYLCFLLSPQYRKHLIVIVVSCVIIVVSAITIGVAVALLSSSTAKITGAVITITTTTTTTTTTTYDNGNCSNGSVYTNNQCEECGLSNYIKNVKRLILKQNEIPKIIGGIEAINHSWPAHAYVKIGSKVCGGTLVTRRTVITAAHCVSSGSTLQSALTAKVYLGLHQRYISGSVPSPGVEYSVSSIVRHPSYVYTTYRNDVALLILSSTVTLNEYIKLACLPNTLSSTYPGLTTSSWAVGWGTTNAGTLATYLQNVKLPIVASSSCAANLAYFSGTSQICAGVQSYDTCSGDSGGGLYVLDTSSGVSRFVLCGITSYGTGCGSVPGAYQRTSFYLDWIRSNWVK